MWDSVMFSSYYITNLIRQDMTVEEWIYCFGKHMEEYKEGVTSEEIMKVLNSNEYLKAEGRCGWTVLGVAANKNNIALIKYFVSKDPTIVNSNGNEEKTVLSVAVEYGCTEAVKVLLELGADPNLVKKNGQLRCLNLAERKKNTEIIDLLKSKGAQNSPTFSNNEEE